MWGSCFFCALPPASVRRPLRHPLTAHTHTYLSFTHSFVTPLCDTPLFDTTLSHTCLSHHFVSHLSFTHTFVTHLSFTRPFAHNFVIHSLTHTTLLHTTLNSQVSTVKTEVFFCIFSCLCKTASTAGSIHGNSYFAFFLGFCILLIGFCLYRETNTIQTNHRKHN